MKVTTESDQNDTPAGESAFREAARTHVRGIREHYLDRLPRTDRAALRRMLDSVTRCD